MAYWQWGDPLAPHVVVCAHGLSRQGRDFAVLAQALCARTGNQIRVVCPDVAGRGRSDWLKDATGYQIPAYAADMAALLAQLKPAQLDWVGTSMGGLIGMVLCGQTELAAAPGRPKQGTAPSGLEPAASSLLEQAWTGDRGEASREPRPARPRAAHEVASVGAILPVPVRRLVLNDVGPAMQWQALQRIGEYLGDTGLFASEQQAADALWATSTSFGPHTAEQWLAFSRPMLKPAGDGSANLTLHYDPAIAVPFAGVTQESVAQGEAAVWQLYDNIQAETLLLRGAESDLLSIETAQAMTLRGPKARLFEFAGVGHAHTLIADDQVAAVLDFLLA